MDEPASTSHLFLGCSFIGKVTSFFALPVQGAIPHYEFASLRDLLLRDSRHTVVASLNAMRGTLIDPIIPQAARGRHWDQIAQAHAKI